MIGTAEVISTHLPRRALRLPRRDLHAGEHRLRGRRERRARPARRASSSARRGRRGDTIRASRIFGRRSSRRPQPGLRFQRKDTEQYHVCLGAPGISRSDRCASPRRSSTRSSAARPRRGSSRRSARSGGWPTRSTASLSQYADTGRSGSTSGPARTTSAEALAIAVERDRRHRRRQSQARRAPACAGEPQGPVAAFHGVDLDRMTRLGKSIVTEPRSCRSTELTAEIDAVDAETVCEPRCGALRSGAALRSGDRAERGALPGGDRAGAAPSLARAA